MNTRTGNNSRCCKPENAPYKWQFWYEPKHVSVQEILRWLESLNVFARSHEEGRIARLFELAANGNLWDSEDPATLIKPIHSHPEIFELRHRALNKTLRFYHGEPEAYPKHLIALHKHFKRDNSSQQEEIDFAITMYKPTEWIQH